MLKKEESLLYYFKSEFMNRILFILIRCNLIDEYYLTCSYRPRPRFSKKSVGQFPRYFGRNIKSNPIRFLLSDFLKMDTSLQHIIELE